MNYDEGFKMNRQDAAIVLDHVSKVIGKLQNIVRNLAAAASKAEMAVDVEREMVDVDDEIDEEIVYTRAAPISDDLFSSMRNAVMSLSDLATVPPVFEEINMTDGESFLQKENEKLSEEMKKFVEVFLEDDAIYVRTPMLWTRNGRTIRGANGRAIGPERATIFRGEVLEAIQNHPQFSSYDFTKFADKIIHFLYVYEDLSANRFLIADNDNHETKYIQDVITMFLPNGDMPLTCSIFSSAIRSKTIPEGTYITVTSRQNGVKSDGEIVSFWKHKSLQ